MQTYGVRDHDGKNCPSMSAAAINPALQSEPRTWLVRIVGVELGYEPRDNDHLDYEYDCV